MILNFNKMHSLGNDFVILDLISQRAKLQHDVYSRIADRHFGIGCDQIIVLNPPSKPELDFKYLIYNNDGSTASQCINGVRCAARAFVDLGLSTKTSLSAECSAGVTELEVNAKEVSASISFTAKTLATSKLQEPGLETHELHSLSLGNPHNICIIPKLGTDTATEHGPKLSKLGDFEDGANVGFMQIINNQHAKLRTYERGAGQTFACGSNAAAAGIVGYKLGLLEAKSTIEFEHGSLAIELDEAKQVLRLSGDTNHSFQGRFKI